MVSATMGTPYPFCKPGVAGLRGARTKEGGDAKDIGRKEMENLTLWGTPSLEMARGFLGDRGAGHIPEGHGPTSWAWTLLLSSLPEGIADASPLQGCGGSPQLFPFKKEPSLLRLSP